MPKSYRNLWVFGDSFTTPGVQVKPDDSFWMLVARFLNADSIYNYSWPRNTLDSVIHLLTSESEQYDWENDFFLIGIPPLVRLTVVSENPNHTFYRRVFDTDAQESRPQQILCHHGLENKSFYDDPIATRFEDPTWTEIQACRNIFLVNSWLDSKNANYLVLNLSKSFQNDSPATGKFLLDKCFGHPRNILSGQDTYRDVNYGINKPGDYDKFGWDGHHGPTGNKYFFEKSLLPRLTKM